MPKQTLTAAEHTALTEMGIDGLNWRVGARNARIFLGYFGLRGVPKGTLEEVGGREALTRERARQIVARVRHKLGYVPETRK